MSRRSLSLLLVGTAVAVIFAATLVVAAIIGTPDHEPEPTPVTLIVRCPDGGHAVITRGGDITSACLAP